MKKLIIHFASLVLVTVMRETLPRIRYGTYLVQVGSLHKEFIVSLYILVGGGKCVHLFMLKKCFSNHF